MPCWRGIWRSRRARWRVGRERGWSFCNQCIRARVSDRFGVVGPEDRLHQLVGRGDHRSCVKLHLQRPARSVVARNWCPLNA